MSFLTDEVLIGVIAFGALIAMFLAEFFIYERPLTRCLLETIITGIVVIVFIANICYKTDFYNYFYLALEIVIFLTVLVQGWLAYFRYRKWF